MSMMTTVDRPMSLLACVATSMMAFGVAFGSIEVANPSHAEAGKVKKAKKVLKFVSKGARKFERKMRGKGKFGRALGKAVGKVGRGAGKLRKGIGKVQRGVGRAVGKVCKGPCAKALKAGRKINRGIERLERRAFRTAKRGIGKLAPGNRRKNLSRRKVKLYPSVGRKFRHSARKHVIRQHMQTRRRNQQNTRRIGRTRQIGRRAVQRQFMPIHRKAAVRRLVRRR